MYVWRSVLPSGRTLMRCFPVILPVQMRHEKHWRNLQKHETRRDQGRGAAMATCVAYVLGNILIINWYYYKKINIPLFWKNILHMCPVMFVMGAAGWFVLDHLRIDNWFVFFALAAVYTVIYWVLAYLFMMNNYEKAFIRAIKAFILKMMCRLQKQ